VSSYVENSLLCAEIPHLKFANHLLLGSNDKTPPLWSLFRFDLVGKALKERDIVASDIKVNNINNKVV
jgi:hypothetical protein